MKKNRFIQSAYILCASLAIVLMSVSCSNLSDEFKTDQSQKTILKINLQSEARTATPLLQIGQFSNFKLTGKKESDENAQTIGKANGYATANDLQNVEIALPAGASGSTWEFTLTAELSSSAETGSSETFTSTSTKFINQGQNVIQFYFANKDFDYTQGTGGYSVTFDWSVISENADKVNKVVAVLQNTAEGGTKTEYPAIIPTGQEVTLADNVAAGVYRLHVYFYYTDAQVAYWQEIVKVSNGLTSFANHEITKFSKTYTINYVLNADSGVTNPCPQIVALDTDIYKHGFPTRTGYSFYGWYSDEALTKPFEIRQVTNGISVYAKWIEGNNAKVVTKDTIVTAIAAATSTDKANPTLIKALGVFTEEDFTAAATALKAKEDSDDNSSNDVYIALDFTEVQTDVTAFKYFRDCKCLAGIGIPDSINFDDTTLYWNPGNPLSFGENTQYITVSGNNTAVSSIDGVLFAKEGKILVYFPNGKECESNVYKTPESVTEICDGAFDHSLKIQKLTIGTNVGIIHRRAFGYWSRPTIEFEDNDTVWISGSEQYYTDWKYLSITSSNYHYNIQEYFATENYGYSYSYGYGYKKLAGVTFASIINEATVIPLTVTSGVGSDTENYNLNTVGFNTMTGGNSANWFSISTKPNYKYHLYYCTSYTSSLFTKTEDTEVSDMGYLELYSSDGKKCYLTQYNTIATSEFTAEGSVTYIKAGSSGPAYLLIREEAPESSGGNEGGE